MISVLIISMMVATVYSSALNPSLEDQVVAKRDKTSETVSTKQPKKDRNPSELNQDEDVEHECAEKAPVERLEVWNPRIFTNEIYLRIDSVGSLLKRYSEDYTERELKLKKIKDLQTNLTELETLLKKKITRKTEKLMVFLALTVELEKLKSEENGKKKDSTETGKSERDEEVISKEFKSLTKELETFNEKLTEVLADILKIEKEKEKIETKKERILKDIEKLKKEDGYVAEDMPVNKTKIENYERELNNHYTYFKGVLLYNPYSKKYPEVIKKLETSVKKIRNELKKFHDLKPLEENVSKDSE